jgi:hypothetical protein
VQVAYTLKVNADAPYGSTIGSAESTVGGVIVKCPAVQVQKNLTVQQQTKLIEAVQELRASENTLAGLELVNKLYEMATGTKNVFVTTDASEIMEGANGIFTPKQMSLETVPQQIYQLGRSDLYGKMVAPTLYGGYRMWTALWKQDRVRLPMEHDLQIGDLLIYKGQPEWGMYLYLGEDLGFANMSRATLDADTLSVDIRLEQLLGCDYYFAILRPSMTQ